MSAWCLSRREAYCYSPCSLFFSSRIDYNCTCVYFLSAFEIEAIRHYSSMGPGWVPGRGKREGDREAQGQGHGEEPSLGTASQAGWTWRCWGQDQEWLHAGVQPGARPQARLQRWGRHEDMRCRVGWESSMCAGKVPTSWLCAQTSMKEETRKGPTKWPSYLGDLILASVWAVVHKVMEATTWAESGTEQAQKKANVKGRDWVKGWEKSEGKSLQLKC